MILPWLGDWVNSPPVGSYLQLNPFLRVETVRSMLLGEVSSRKSPFEFDYC